MSPLVIPTDNAGQTLAQLRDRMDARGYDNLTVDRKSRLVNDALNWIYRQERWPWMEYTGQGVAPLLVSRLVAVESAHIYDATVTRQRRLEHISAKEIQAMGADVDDPGWPQGFYVTGGETINLWPKPAATVQIKVRAWVMPPELTQDTDIPEIPQAFAEVIEDKACQLAAKDNHDWETVTALGTLCDTAIAELREDSLLQQTANGGHVVFTGEWA